MNVLADAFHRTTGEVAEVSLKETLGGGIESLEESLISLEERNKFIEDMNYHQDTLEETVTGLESVYDYLSASLEDGGITHSEAEALSLAQVGSVSIESQQLMVSSESFTKLPQRMQGTEVSMEAISDKLKTIWKTIRDAIQKALNAVMEFLANVFSSVSKLKNRVDNYDKAIKGLKDKELKDEEVQVTNAPRLVFLGRVEPGAVTNGVDSTYNVVRYMFSRYPQAVENYYTSINDITEEKASFIIAHEDQEDPEEMYKDPVEELISDIETVSNIEILGDLSFQPTDVRVRKSTISAKLPTLQEARDNDIPETMMVKPLSKDQMESIVEKMRDTLEVIEGKKKVFDKIEKARQKSIKLGDRILKDADKSLAKEYGQRMKFRTMMKQLQGDAMRPVTQLSRHSLTSFRAVLSYVRVSIKAHG